MGDSIEEPLGYFEIGFILILLVRAGRFKDLAVGWIYQLRVIGGTALVQVIPARHTPSLKTFLQSFLQWGSKLSLLN